MIICNNHAIFYRIMVTLHCATIRDYRDGTNETIGGKGRDDPIDVQLDINGLYTGSINNKKHIYFYSIIYRKYREKVMWPEINRYIRYDEKFV